MLETQIHHLESKIKKMPPGKLSIARNGKNYKWYHLLAGKAIYLPKKKRELAQQLAHKKYLSQTLEYKIQEKQAIQFYLNHCKNPDKIEKISILRVSARALIFAKSSSFSASPRTRILPSRTPVEPPIKP